MIYNGNVDTRIGLNSQKTRTILGDTIYLEDEAFLDISITLTTLTRCYSSVANDIQLNVRSSSHLFRLYRIARMNEG